MNVFQDSSLLLNRFEDVPGVTFGLGDAQFIRIDEQELQALTFLDHRALNKPVALRLALDDFARQADAAPSSHAFGLIYHSAFCCSTYLARCLDATGIGRALKEPYALTQTSFYQANDACQQFDSPAAWDRFLRSTVAFMSRPAAGGRFPVIKTHNFSIVLAQDIARLFPGRAKGLFIYSDLQSFLISTLKSRERREFSRLLLKSLNPRKTTALGIPWVDSSRLPDGPAAAYCWLMHMAYFDIAAARHDGLAFSSLDCEILLERPAETMAAIAALFGHDVNHDHIVAGLESDQVKKHAKNPRREFSAELRHTELQTHGFRLRREIKESLRWFDDLALRDELRCAPARPLPVSGAS